MLACPRCGTGLLPAATVCTSCCHRLDDDAPEPTGLIEVAAPPADPEPAPTPRSVPALPQPQRESWVEPRPGLTEYANATRNRYEGRGNGLGIPNQRGAAFHPLRVSATPPPNPFLEAERRQQANYRSGRQAASEG